MKAIKRADIPFAQISNELLQNKSISLKAKGLWAYLQSKPDNWEFSSWRMEKELKEGVKSIRSSLNELEENGYLERRKLQNGRMVYTLRYESDNTSAKTAKSQNGNKQKRQGAKTGSIIKKEDNKEINIKRNSGESRRFTPPSLQELSDYIKENNYSVNGENFIDFYASKGWMVGKNKMKDWRAAVRTWERRKKKINEPESVGEYKQSADEYRENYFQTYGVYPIT